MSNDADNSALSSQEYITFIKVQPWPSWIESWTCNLRLWIWISAPEGIVHDWGETLEQGTEPPTAPRAPQRRLPTAPKCVSTWMG